MQYKVINKASCIKRKFPANYVEQDLFFIKDHITYFTQNAYLREYHNVLLSPESVVYKNLIVQADSLASLEYKRYYQYRHLIKKTIVGKKKYLSQDKFLLATDNWSSGHFHWFCDVLPKLWAVRNEAHKFVLLLPDTVYMNQIGIPTIERLGLKFRGIQMMGNKNLYYARTLYFISRISKSGTVDDNLMKEMCGGLRGSEENPSKRIYITRNNARFRKVVNETELISLLEKYKFEILDSDLLSLNDRMKLFNSCKILLSMHGAGLTNMVFMPQGGKVVEFRKKEEPGNHSYWHLADSLGLSYYYYFGIPDSEKPLEGEGCNLTIPVKDFESRILNSLCN